jgi:uncharacterized cupin superfamily protein
MRRENLLSAVLGREQTIEGFAWRAARIGDRLAAELIGASLYELPEGQTSFPFHYHHGVEEWFYVVDGEPTLRTPDGTSVLGPGVLVCFPQGPEGAHSVQGPGRVLILSANRQPSISVYPDSGKLGTRPATRADVLNFRREDAVDYWDGEGE